MEKRELDSMQERAARTHPEPRVQFAGPVERISRQRCAQLFRVNADLMHAPRLDVEPDQGDGTGQGRIAG